MSLMICLKTYCTIGYITMYSFGVLVILLISETLHHMATISKSHQMEVLDVVHTNHSIWGDVLVIDKAINRVD